MNITKGVLSLLGGEGVLKQSVRSDFDWIRVVRDGIPTRAVKIFFNTSQLGQEEIVSALHISPRTFTRRMSMSKLDPLESEKLIRLMRIYVFAREVFNNDNEKSLEWLRRSNRALSGQSPISLLDSDLGASQVEGVLGRIQEGVYG